jgi:hypothetical protein
MTEQCSKDVGLEVLTVVVMMSSIFWDVTGVALWKLTDALEKQRQKALLAACFMPVSCLAYSSTPKMEVTCSSETSVDLQQTTGHHIPADRTLQCSNEFVRLLNRKETVFGLSTPLWHPHN